MTVSRLKSRAQLVEPMLLLGEPIERVTSYNYLGVILTVSATTAQDWLDSVSLGCGHVVIATKLIIIHNTYKLQQ